MVATVDIHPALAALIIVAILYYVLHAFRVRS